MTPGTEPRSGRCGRRRGAVSPDRLQPFVECDGLGSMDSTAATLSPHNTCAAGSATTVTSVVDLTVLDRRTHGRGE